jgi:polar amino acid transport system substrate-binding protein
MPDQRIILTDFAVQSVWGGLRLFSFVLMRLVSGEFIMKFKSLLLFLCLQPMFAWSAESLRLATSEWPPFTGAASERHIAEDLVTLALTKTGREVVLSLLPWREALRGAQDGRYHGLVVAWHSAEREHKLLYSRPILENRILAVTLDTAGMTVSSAADLNGKRVGKVAGYTYGEELDGLELGKTVLSPDDRQALQRLLKGEFDVLLIDDLSLRYLLPELVSDQRARLQSHKILAVLSLHFVLAKHRADAEKIMAGFNQAIDIMVADGSYNEVLGVSWVVADTDQDGVSEYIPTRQVLDLSAPPEDNHYEVFQTEPGLQLSPRRVYQVGGQQYDNWGDAKQAIIDEAQTEPGNRMIQDNRYQIGVPLY